jgi:hypothetical protein
MALNFPSNPNNGDTYTESSTTWQYDGVAWNIAPSGTSTFPNTFGTVVVDGTSLSSTASGDDLRVNSGSGVTIISNEGTNTITINADTVTPDEVGFYIAADDSTQRLLGTGETIQFIGGTGITTSSDIEGNITINGQVLGTFNNLSDATASSLTIDKIYEPAMVMFRVDNNGTLAYTMSHYTGTNPQIYVLSGTTVAFDLDAIPGLPFEIQDPLGDPYNTGLVHVDTDGTISTEAAAQGKDSGTLYWRIPESTTGGYRYQCQTQVSMVGAITIKRLSVI